MSSHGDIINVARHTSGLVVDLGCGSGILAQALLVAGYDVLGVDVSQAMIRLARRQAPKAKFVAQSLRTVRLPACVAVTAIGECLNYRSDEDPKADPNDVFRRIFLALRPGGVFVFDIAEPALADEGNGTPTMVEGKDWMVVSEKRGDPSRNRITRRIIAYRRIGKLYRRSEEIHHLQLFQRTEILEGLRASGFRARAIAAYGRQHLLPGRVGFVAIKPKR
jgi:SAM-dependent methyltransferase